MSGVMIAAVIAVVTSAQAEPAERLVQFMNSAADRGIAFTAKAGNTVFTGKLSYQSPNYQQFDIYQGKSGIHYIQQAKRILVVNDSDQTYYEYKGFDRWVGPPVEAGPAVDIYPSFLWSWRDPKNLEGLQFEKTETIGGIVVDTLKQTVQVEDGDLVIHISIAKDGAPRRVHVIPPQDPPFTFDFEKFTWPYVDLKTWKYQPPIGYSLGNAPKIFRPLTAGSPVDLAGIKDSTGTPIVSLNKKGMAILVTAADGKPDNAIVSAVEEAQKALEKLGVKVIELQLDTTQASKRHWPVVVNSNPLTTQLDVPVTPYIFFLDKENTVIRAWAGYAPDQKVKLLKTATDAYAPQEESE